MAAQIRWYHTIEFPDGTVTRGIYDHRTIAPKLPFPDLSGKRCLDVGTCDGFWALEMAKRGAREVVGVDVDDPEDRDFPAGVAPDTSAGPERFRLANEAFGNPVERRVVNVYDLSPERVGRFDVAFVGAILLHLRDPVLALEHIRSVADEVIIFDVVWVSGSILFPRRPTAWLFGKKTSRWWTANRAGIERMATAAGFDVIGRKSPVWVPWGRGGPLGRPPAEAARITKLAWRAQKRTGVPHAWVHARARAI